MGKLIKSSIKDPFNNFDFYFKESDEKKKVSKKFKIDQFKGINLDVGCGENKQEGCVGLDIRPIPGVDIVHDLESVPYPLENEVCNSIIASHVVEHINPAKFGLINVMNEWWRIMKPGGRLMIAAPYGVSRGFLQDPTHTKPVTEDTFTYFDPTNRNSLWIIYRPLPWKILINAWHVNGNLEVLLQKMPKEDVVITENQVIIDKKWADVKTLLKNCDK